MVTATATITATTTDAMRSGLRERAADMFSPGISTGRPRSASDPPHSLGALARALGRRF